MKIHKTSIYFWENLIRLQEGHLKEEKKKKGPSGREFWTATTQNKCTGLLKTAFLTLFTGKTQTT